MESTNKNIINSHNLIDRSNNVLNSYNLCDKHNNIINNHNLCDDHKNNIVNDDMNDNTNLHNKDMAKIKKVAFFVGIFMLLELWGHYKSNSLSLLADSLHLLIDLSGFIISLFTLKKAKKKANDRYTFGYQRVEIVGAIISILFIWIAVIYLIYESINNYGHPKEINGKLFLIIAIIGLIVNIISLFILNDGLTFSFVTNSNKKKSNSKNKKSNLNDKNINLNHNDVMYDHNHINDNENENHKKYNEDKNEDNEGARPHIVTLCQHHNHIGCSSSSLKNEKQNLNVRATYIHIIGDIIQSIGIILASVVIYFRPDLVIFDIICTFIFAILVFSSTLSILSEGLNILMEGAPKGIDLDEIRSFILSEGNNVISKDNNVLPKDNNVLSKSNGLKIQTLKCWSIDMHNRMVLLKIKANYLKIEDYENLLNKINLYLKEDLGIENTLVQINTPNINK